MFFNYIKTAVRNIGRHRFFSMINVFGLSLAMSICMAIMMLVADQLQYDAYNTKRKTIYRINSIAVDPQTGVERKGAIINSTNTPMLRDELMDNQTGIKQVVRFKRGFGNGWMELENQNVNIPLGGYFAEPGALEMFQYELQHGDAATALVAPYSVVLTRKAADKIFGEDNPIGKTIKVGELGLYTVTGVLRETERKSHIAFEALASWSTLESLDNQGKLDARLDEWTDFWSSWVYIETDLQPTEIQSKLDRIYDAKIATITKPDANKMRFSTQRLDEITPGPFQNNPIGPSLPWLLVYILGGLAGAILITSCFNFTNLSIARSLTRAREIGVRKVNGASRGQIFTQFLCEAVIVSFAALAFAMVLLVALKPMILELNFARLFRWDLESNYVVYSVFAAFALAVGLLAGSFPAIVLSGFKPVKVLKDVAGMRLFSRMGLRKALLVSQFTLALIFILSVTVLYKQLDLFLNKDHGFEKENHLMVRLNGTSQTSLKTELMKYPNITSVSAVSHLPAAGTTYGDGFKSDDQTEWTSFNYFIVDESYTENLGLKLVAGEFFKASNDESNKNLVVINEEAVRTMHYDNAIDAIGQQITYRSDSSRLTIIGVVKDYNHQALLSKIEPLALMYRPSEFSILQVKYSGTMDEARASVNKAWATVNPGLKSDVKDMADEIMLLYNTLFGDAWRVLGFIAFMAIVISCLGLLGMATYATETRLKEVSIRKVLGSSNPALIYLLSKGFLGILLIAIGIGVPASYFLNTMWLEFLPYHINVDISVISLGVGLLILFGAITIGSQTWRATFVNPVDNLKSE